MTEAESTELDYQDRMQGRALHQKNIDNAVVEKGWRWAMSDECVPVLPLRDDPRDWKLDLAEWELCEWRKLGLLPTGEGGKPVTKRQNEIWEVPNPSRDLALFEREMIEGLSRWSPNFDWVPRPLATGDFFPDFLQWASSMR